MSTISTKLSKALFKKIKETEAPSAILSEAIEENGLNCPSCGKPWPRRTEKNEKKMPAGFYVSNEKIKDLHNLSAFVEVLMCKKLGVCLTCHKEGT